MEGSTFEVKGENDVDQGYQGKGMGRCGEFELEEQEQYEE